MFVYSDLISSMKIEKEHEPSRADQLRAYYATRPDRSRVGPTAARLAVCVLKFIKTIWKIFLCSYYYSSSPGEPVDIFGAPPLRIFELETERTETPVVELATWNYLEERDLRLLVTHPPSNIFDQLIQWTNEGKIWRFPIDNEQGTYLKMIKLIITVT